MSTRAAIIHKTTHGYAGIYCHSDGYVDGVGLTLRDHYQDPQTVADLIALGDISTLSTRVHPNNPANHSFDEPEGGYDGTTRAYRRDRGDTNQGPAVGNTANEVADQIGHNGHVYVFDDRSGQPAWTHNDVPLDYELERLGILEQAAT